MGGLDGSDEWLLLGSWSEPEKNGQNHGQGIELQWDQGKVIRFPDVSLLIDFLKKAA
jgi:hypothetical protein